MLESVTNGICSLDEKEFLNPLRSTEQKVQKLEKKTEAAEASMNSTGKIAHTFMFREKVYADGNPKTGPGTVSIVAKDGKVPFGKGIAHIETPEFTSPLEIMLLRKGDKLVGTGQTEDGKEVEVEVKDWVTARIGYDRHSYMIEGADKALFEHAQKQLELGHGDPRPEEIAAAIIADIETLSRGEKSDTSYAGDWSRTRFAALNTLEPEDRLEVSRLVRNWVQRERSDIKTVCVWDREEVINRNRDKKTHLWAAIKFGPSAEELKARKEELQKQGAKLGALYAGYDEMARLLSQSVKKDNAQQVNYRSPTSKAMEEETNKSQSAFWAACKEIRPKTVADLVVAVPVLEAKLERLKVWGHPTEELDPVMLRRVIDKLRAVVQHPNAAYVAYPGELGAAWSLATTCFLPHNYEMGNLEPMLEEMMTVLNALDLRFGLPSSLEFAGVSAATKKGQQLSKPVISDLADLGRLTEELSASLHAEQTELSAVMERMGAAAKRLGAHPLAKFFRVVSYRGDAWRDIIKEGKLDAVEWAKTKDDKHAWASVLSTYKGYIKEFERTFQDLELLRPITVEPYSQALP